MQSRIVRRLADAANHVLMQNRWARLRLQSHAGARLRLDFAPGSVRVDISSLGFLVAPPATESCSAPDLVVTVPYFAWPQMLAGRSTLLEHTRLAGQADLAESVGLVLRELRWDAEDDLARWIGDVAAHRVVQTASTAMTHFRGLVSRLHGSLTDYLQHDAPAVTSQAAARERIKGLDALILEIKALERRVSRL